MVVIVGASRPSPVRRRNRNALAAGVWLVFLAYTVVSLQSSLRAGGEGGRHGRVGCCQGCNSDHLASICEKCLFPLVEGVVKAACYP